MGYLWQNYGINLDKVWDTFSKNNGIYFENIGYIWSKLWDPLAMTIGFLLDIFGKNYWIYWAKIMAYILGYIG